MFDAHRHEFEARGISWETFRQPDMLDAITTTTDSDPEPTTTTTTTTKTIIKKVAFADRKTTVEAGELVPGRQVAVEGGRIVFSDGVDRKSMG